MRDKIFKTENEIETKLTTEANEIDFEGRR